MKPGPTSIADRIRWVIGSLDITQGAFASLANMSPSQFSVLLRRLNERPYAIELETVLRLAHAGRVAPKWLLMGEGEPYDQGGLQGTPRPPPLRENPYFETHLGELRRQNFIVPPELAAWIGEVALPLDHASELTPDVVAALARLRLQMLYGRMMELVEHAPLSYGPIVVAPPKASKRTSARTPSPKPRPKKPSTRRGRSR